MNATFRASACGAALLGLAIVSGCGGDTDEPISPALMIGNEPAPGAPVELPPSFPRDIPRHPNGRVDAVAMSSEQGISVTLGVEGSPDAVAGYYADAFAAEGWSTQVRPSPGGTAIFADKGNRSAAATVTATPGGSAVRIIVVEMPRPAGG